MKVVSIHGRFQPFHNGHLEYFKWARARADMVFIGLTQVFGSDDGFFPGADHRGKPESNPLTYFERSRIINAALAFEGFDRSEFEVIPFPIELQHQLRKFISQDVLCYTTLHSEWNHEKMRILQATGYKVEALVLNEENVPRRSGSEIRRLIASNNSDWKLFVPEGAVFEIEQRYLSRFQ